MQELEAVQTLVAELDPLGVYLYGSAVHGGLRPRSDLNVLVVTERRTGETERRRLLKQVQGIEGRSVEVTLMARGEAHDPILAHQVLRASRTLHGPPPQTWLEPPSSDALRAALVAAADPVLEGLDADPTSTILALCRIYCALVTGEWVPKGDAAAWAHGRFPHIALQRAQAVYLGGLPETYTGIDLDYAAGNLRALIAQQDRA